MYVIPFVGGRLIQYNRLVEWHPGRIMGRRLAGFVAATPETAFYSLALLAPSMAKSQGEAKGYPCTKRYHQILNGA